METTTVAQEVFFDESGNTGANLLDTDQPFFSYAAVAIDEAEAETVVKSLKNKYGLQGRELKFSRIKNYSKAKLIVDDFLEAIKGRASFTCFDKKYSLCAQFFEYIFEPCISDYNGLFYAAGFHHYITYSLYKHFFGKNTNSEMMVNFERIMMKNKKTEIVQTFVREYEQMQLPSSSIGLEDMLKVFITYNKQQIIDELDFLSGDTAIDKYTGDLCFTALFSLCSAMCHKYKSIKISYDKSSILEAQNDTIKELADHEFRIPNLNPYLEDKEERIYIDKNIEAKDSKSNYGIQLADMLAGIVNDAYKINNKNVIKKLFTYTIKPLIVVPDINKGSEVELLESLYDEIFALLVRNSIHGKPLVDDYVKELLLKLRYISNVFPV